MNQLRPIKIVSKKSIGVQPVYDISVPEVHHYILDNGIVSHNSGFIYASSIVIAMKKLKLKEDDDGNKISEVRGIRSACKVMKTRYAKPFESVQVKIPYDTGMSPYSGLVDFFEKKNTLKKSGNRLSYISQVSGEETLKYRRAWEANEDNCLDLVMSEFHAHASEIHNDVSEQEETDGSGHD